MKDTIATFWQNLNNMQRIVVVIIAQILFVMIIITIINSVFQEKQHVFSTDNTGQTSQVPEEEKRAYEDALWEVISQHVEGVDKNIIDDAVVREDSYKEEYDEESGATQASFIIDIDSIKQSYKIIIGWDSNGTATPIIDCLPISEAKYPDSVCYGTYRNSNDLSLYLPYSTEEPDEGLSPDLIIRGNEYDHTITITLTLCNTEENKKKAMDYLNSTPIKLSEYQMIYDINSIDSICEGDN